jgi:hypothetical protein
LTLKPGEAVIVTFHDKPHQAVVEKPVGHGWYLCRIRQDPSDDYTGIQPPENNLKSVSLDFTTAVRRSDIHRAGS